MPDNPFNSTPEVRAFDDIPAIRGRIYDNVAQAYTESYPRENTRHRLELTDVRYDDDAPTSLADQKKAIITGKTLRRSLSGTWSLYDKGTNQLVEQRRSRVAYVPHLTDRGTYIVNGTEYSMANQLRLKPGVYTRKKENGELESHFNIMPGSGSSFRIHLEPETGAFYAKVGQSQIPLYPILKAVGVRDGDMAKFWGKDLLQANQPLDNEKHVDKAWEKFTTRRAKLGLGELDPAQPVNKAAELQTAFDAMRLDPDVSISTLQAPHDKVTPEVLLKATKKLIGISKGTTETDDRDHIAYQSIMGPEDLFAERVRKDAGQAARAQLWKATFRQSLDPIVNHEPRTKQLLAAIQHSGLGQAVEESNPLDVFDQLHRVTRMGAGGIPSTDAIPEESKAVQPSYLGFIDPARTSESEKAGVDNRLAYRTLKGADGKLYTPMIGKGGKEQLVSSVKAATATIAFPGELAAAAKENRPVRAMVKGRMQLVDAKDVDYELPSHEDMFSPHAHLVPLLSSIKTHRMLMASRMLNQTLPLEQPEAPHVRTARRSDIPGDSFERWYGEHAGALRSKTPGTVTKVGKDFIELMTPQGKVTHELYDNMPLNRKTLVRNTPIVQRGQQVNAGDLLATSNFTDNEGNLALGKNLRVGFLPYKGSVVDSTSTFWYDDRGCPHFGPISSFSMAKKAKTLSIDNALEGKACAIDKYLSYRVEDAELVKVTTESGRRVTATRDHSFVTLGPDGYLTDILGSDLNPKTTYLPRLKYVDLPVVHTEVTMKSARLPAIRLPLSWKLGFLTGLYIAEGNRSRSKIAIAVTDPVELRCIQAAVRDVLGCEARYHGRALIIGKAQFTEWVTSTCGMLAHNKRIPDIAFGAPLKFREGLISGYFCGDGCVSVKENACGGVQAVTTSRLLADGLGLLLASIDIETTRCECNVPRLDSGEALYVRIAGNDLWKLPAFPHSNKWKRLVKAKASFHNGRSLDLIPLFANVRDKFYALARGQSKKDYARIQAAVYRGRVSRSDVIALVPPDTSDDDLRRLREIATSTNVAWDQIRSLTPVLYTGTVYDFDIRPSQNFVCVDTLITHNSTVEDAIVVSESAARKLRSEHMYQHDVDLEPGQKISKRGFVSKFPGSFTKAQLENFDDQGVIRPGTTVQKGDPLVLSMTKSAPKGQGVLHKMGKDAWKDTSELWKHEDEGVVTDVHVGPRQVNVVVKSLHTTGLADKLCYSRDTEVLTADGWKPVYDVTLTDRVASLTPEGELEYIAPEQLHAYHHRGRMYDLNTTQVSLCVTDNHNLYVRKRYREHFELRPAAEMCGTFYRMKNNANYSGGDRPEYFEIPGYVGRCGQGGRGSKQRPSLLLKTELFAALLGAYLSEGHCLRQPGNRGIEFTQIKEPNRSQLIDLLQTYGMSFNAQADPTKIKLCNERLFRYFQQFGRCNTKFIPNEVFSWTRDLLEILFEWLMWGDGHKGKTHWVYTTTSKRLADDVQRLCLHIGYAARILPTHPENVAPRKIDGRNITSKRIRYDVFVYRKKNEPSINHGHHKEQRGQLEGWSQYDGVVYCVSLPRNHVLYVRRNGRAVWCGNSPRNGGKGVISKVVPDHLMPHDESGQPLEVIMHPFGIVSRTNPSALMEASLGKIAAKTGKTYTLPGFHDVNNVEFVRQELKRHGMSSTETLLDPETGRKIPNVFVGNMWMSKLHHMADDKLTARGDEGGYTADMMPAKAGGDDSAKRVGGLETYSLLSAGAHEVLKDIKLVRGQRNDDYWRAFRLGYPPPSPDQPFVYKKFWNDLKSAGVNVQKNGNYVNIMALRDKDIDDMSRGEITKAETLDFDNMNPIAGGLFDLGLTGGHKGSGWGHVNLAEPLPNPVFEDSVRRLLGLTEPRFRKILRGEEQLDGEVGGHAIQRALSRINVGREIETQKQVFETASKSRRDDAVKKLRVLTMLQKTGIKPQELVLTKAPVMPPMFRPISRAGKLTVVSDPNLLYKELMLANDHVKAMTGELGRGGAGPEREALYDSFKALTGLADPLQPKLAEKGVRGILSHALGIGGSPKFSAVQRKLIGTATDMVGRAVITPNPALDMDHVGLPEEKAWTLYRPFIVRDLVRRGTPAMQAANMAANKDPRAKEALLREMAHRPVIVNRAPTLHRYGIMAAMPVLTHGPALEVSPVVSPGFGADYDGDQENFHVPVSDSAVTEAKQKLLPSKNLRSVKHFDAHYEPIQEFLHGLWLATNKPSDKQVRSFVDEKAVEQAYRRGEISVNDRIELLNHKDKT